MSRRTSIEQALRHLAPRVPAHECGAILDQAEDSPGLRTASPEKAAWLSMVAYIRHTLTDYDALLDEGYDRDAARHFVLRDMNAILTEWGVRHLLAEDEPS